jgi:hypothetical protein
MSKFLNQLRHLSAFAGHHNYPRPHCSPSTFRLSTLGRIVIYHLPFIILFSCGLDIEDSTPPAPPVWVQKSLPEEWPERGIDADESGRIYLEWKPNLGEDIVAYNIYRTTWYDAYDSLGDYQLIRRLETVSTTDLSFIDETAQLSTKYWYKIKSQDSADNVSVYSDSVSYMLLSQIDISTMTPNSLATINAAGHLSWYYGLSLMMENYCLTILAENNNLVTRVTLSPGNYIDGNESWQIPTDIKFESDQLYKWRIDTGARYIDDIETAGSESQWATFIYNAE